MSEIITMQWAGIFAWTGWLWGGTFGWPWPGAIGGFFAGVAVGNAMRSALLFEISMTATLLAIAAWFVVPRPWLPHAAAGLSTLPLVCYIYLSARDAAVEARGRRIVEGAETLVALIPLLVSKEIEVRIAACARLGRLDVPPDERARVIVQVIEQLGEKNLVGEPQWLTALVKPLAQAVPVPRETLLLLYERLGWVSAGRWPPPENCDEWIQGILFDRVQWDSDAPLLHASQSRIAKGWNVDRMVARLLDTDKEAGTRMAEEAFPAGGLSPAMLLRLDEARSAPVIEREIARAMTTKIERYDRIIEAALGLSPASSFTLLERTLEWDPADYCTEGIFEGQLLKNARPDLGERCAHAPTEGARFLTAVRAHIKRIEVYDWNAKFSPGWHPVARLKMWSALAGALEAHLRG